MSKGYLYENMSIFAEIPASTDPKLYSANLWMAMYNPHPDAKIAVVYGITLDINLLFENNNVSSRPDKNI